MAPTLRVGDVFPDFELPDQRKKPRRLFGFTRPSPMDERLGFLDGYPIILVFGRGFFCPRDQQHMRRLVEFQPELAVNFGRLVTVSADAPLVGAASAPVWEQSGPSYRTKSVRSSVAAGSSPTRIATCATPTPSSASWTPPRPPSSAT